VEAPSLAVERAVVAAAAVRLMPAMPAVARLAAHAASLVRVAVQAVLLVQLARMVFVRPARVVVAEAPVPALPGREARAVFLVVAEVVLVAPISLQQARLALPGAVA
jgi:hypothetical protein